MAKGKNTCKILKEIRKQIAEDNDIELITSECTYQGDCEGTCPKCESEVRYLERELEKRQRMGKAAVFAGMSLGTLFAAAGCSHIVQPLAGAPMDPDSVVMAQREKEPLAGDVVAIDPTPQIARVENPDTIVEPPLMGIVRMFNSYLTFDAEGYQKQLKHLFAPQEMKNLEVVGGDLYFEDVNDEKVYRTLDDLLEAAKEFKAPSYPEGESKLLADVASFVKNASVTGNFKGDMEVEFVVAQSGSTRSVEMVKGLDEALDVAVISSFERMVWNPATFELKNGDAMPFDCRCVMKIHFPIK